MTIILTNILLILILPFIFVGIINKTKAFWGGRCGASIFQPLYDFLRLMKKDSVISSSTSWIFRTAPIVIFSSIILASLLAPIIMGKSIVQIEGAFIIFSYMLGLGKFYALISAMDTGSSFEGIGASREACFTTIVEPAFFITMASIIALSGNTTFESLNLILDNTGIYGSLILTLSVGVLFIMLLTEGCRVPVDDPTTHLELTMIHEVMILDNSGKNLAIITWSAFIKMFLIASLITALIIPNSLSIAVFIPCYLFVMFIIAVLVGTIESAIARFRILHVFEFIFIMSSLSLVILALVSLKIFGS